MTRGDSCSQLTLNVEWEKGEILREKQDRVNILHGVEKRGSSELAAETAATLSVPRPALSPLPFSASSRVPAAGEQAVRWASSHWRVTCSPWSWLEGRAESPLINDSLCELRNVQYISEWFLFKKWLNTLKRPKESSLFT